MTDPQGFAAPGAATDRLRIVFVDNFDSFTWNLVDEFARRGHEVEVWRNNVPADRLLARACGDDAVPRGALPGSAPAGDSGMHRGAPAALLVLSPGPGAPAGAGCCIELCRLAAAARVPLLGVCLGHQAMVEAFGGTVGPAGEVVHGKTSKVRHEGGALFEGVANPFPVGRYHSLAATRLPECLAPVARTGSIVMAVEHREAPQLGVQFHPESILTPDGSRIIANVIRWAAAQPRPGGASTANAAAPAAGTGAPR